MKKLLHMLRAYYVRAEVVDIAFRLSSPGSLLRPAILRQFLLNRHPEYPKNDYGGLKYEESDIDRLEETPGMMPQFLQLVSKAACGKFPCTCGAECYDIELHEDVNFMVAE